MQIFVVNDRSDDKSTPTTSSFYLMAETIYNIYRKHLWVPLCMQSMVNICPAIGDWISSSSFSKVHRHFPETIFLINWDSAHQADEFSNIIFMTTFIFDFTFTVLHIEMSHRRRRCSHSVWTRRWLYLLVPITATAAGTFIILNSLQMNLIYFYHIEFYTVYDCTSWAQFKNMTFINK